MATTRGIRIHISSNIVIPSVVDRGELHCCINYLRVEVRDVVAGDSNYGWCTLDPCRKYAADPYAASEKYVPIMDSNFQSVALTLVALTKALETGHTSAASHDKKKQPVINKLPAHTHHI
jgi:hypothetical protein